MMSKLNLITYVIAFILLLGVFILFSSFELTLKEEIKKPKNVLILISCTVSYLALSFFVGLHDSDWFKVVANLVLASAYFSLLLHFFYGSIRQKLSIVLMILLSSFFYEMLLRFIIAELQDPKKKIEISLEEWPLFYSILVIMLLILFFIKNKKKDEHTVYKPPLSMIIVRLGVILSSSLVAVAAIFSTDSHLVFFFLAFLILFYLYYRLSKNVYKQKYDYQMNEQKYSMLEEHYQEVDKYHEKIRILKHDMKNQLLNIEGQLIQENYEQAINQLSYLIDETSVSDFQHFTPHKAVNILLGHKFRQAQEMGIACEFDIQLAARIGIVDTDLINLVGNLLDNAIEACTYCDERSIYLKMVLHYHCLVIKCENSMDGKHKTLTTRKKDQQEHGIGTESIKRIIKKYHGELTHEWKEQTFSVDLNLFEP